MYATRLLAILSTVWIFSSARAQDTIPTLKGKLVISVLQGTMDCNFTLTNLPHAEDYTIRINAGMNIRYFRNTDDNYNYYYDRAYNDHTGESLGYFFPSNNGKSKFLPRGFQVSYTGKFPVYTDTIKNYSAEDWKGNIAFNGYSLRMDGLQCDWYPVLYDIKKDKVYEKVKYDLDVSCGDCETLYLNGNPPVRATSAHFSSAKEVQLTLYCGKYKVSDVDGTYFLNPDISDAQLKEFGGLTNDIKNYYAKNLAIPYTEKITYVQTTPTSKLNAWLFVAYPTIFNIGRGKYGMISFFDPKTGGFFRPYIAHELGHFYFGSYKSFNSELGDMMSEGFSEFLSLKAARAVIADSVYTKKIGEKINRLKQFSPVPFGKVKTVDDYHNRELYVYNYAPMIFLAIEKEIGEKAMWKWLKTILETNTGFTNYGFLEQTLANTLNDPQKLQSIKGKYWETDESLTNAVQRIGQP